MRAWCRMESAPGGHQAAHWRALGFASIEPALCALSVDEAEKIERINVLLKDLETREQPSIILLEAPDAVMKYNNYLTNGFGIRTYMLAQAAEPDAFLCCIPSELGRCPLWRKSAGTSPCVWEWASMLSMSATPS